MFLFTHKKTFPSHMLIPDIDIFYFNHKGKCDIRASMT